MEPLVSYSGLELTLVEFILGAALVLLGALMTLIFARRGNGAREAKLESHLTQMTERQTELQGRLAQMAEIAPLAKRNYGKVWIRGSIQYRNAWGNRLMTPKSVIRRTSNSFMKGSP